jgi:hypothetical protein
MDIGVKPEAPDIKTPFAKRLQGIDGAIGAADVHQHCHGSDT